MTVHSFAERARESLTPQVRERVEKILAEKLEAWRFEWTDAGGEDDRGGVDLWVWLKNDHRRGIEVKNNRYGEVRLEYVSRRGEGIVGWTVNDRLATDYVLNLWPHRFLLLDFPSLKAVAKLNRDKYTRWYGQKRAESTGQNGANWQTLFVAVPEGILLSDIYNSTVAGAPLSAPRRCGWCGNEHPVGVTCSAAEPAA